MDPEKSELPEHSSQGEEDVPCCVCGDRDSEDSNLIVFCDGCSIAVHQECVGLPEVPEGDWLCDKCQYLADWDNGIRDGFDPDVPSPNGKRASGKKGRRKSSTAAPAQGEDFLNGSRGSDGTERPVVSCIACPDLTGAFRRTNRHGKWIHIVCALYIPELCFMDNGVVDIRGLEPRRATLQCEVCQGMGGCVQCAVTRCCHSYHVTCARKNGQLVRTHMSKKSDQFAYETFCPQHSITKRNEEIRNAKEGQEVPVQLGVFLDDYNWEEIEEKVLSALLGVPPSTPPTHGISEQTFNEIRDYWKRKRYARQNGRRPYIYRLQVAVEEDRVEFDAGRRWQRQDKRSTGVILQSSDFDKFGLMRQLREGFERTRILIDLIRGRELKKQKYVRALKEILSVISRQSRSRKDALLDEDSQMSYSHADPSSIHNEDSNHAFVGHSWVPDSPTRPNKKRPRSELHSFPSDGDVTVEAVLPTVSISPPKGQMIAGTASVSKSTSASAPLKTYSVKKKPKTPIRIPVDPKSAAAWLPSPPVSSKRDGVHRVVPVPQPGTSEPKTIVLQNDDDDEAGEVDIDGVDSSFRGRGISPATDEMDVDDDEANDGDFTAKDATDADENSLDEVVLIGDTSHKRRKLNNGDHKSVPKGKQASMLDFFSRLGQKGLNFFTKSK